MLSGSRGERVLVLLVVLALTLIGQTWLRHEYSKPLTSQPVTPTDPAHPPADPIYSESQAIARAMDLLPPGVVVSASVAKLTSKLNASLWLEGPMASEWGTERAETWLESTPIADPGDGIPYWVVGLRCESLTMEEALDNIGIEDSSVVEGMFFFFDARSGAQPVTGALDTQTWTTFDSLLGLPGDTIPITPMTPVILFADSPAQPTETLSPADYAMISALETATASTPTS